MALGRDRRPAVIFDGDCGFCQRNVDRWRRRHGERVEFIPSQELGERFPQVPRDRFEETVFLVEVDGSVKDGAEAVYALGEFGGRPLLSRLYRGLPGFAPLSEWGYRLVARHRHRLGGGKCQVPDRGE